VWVDLVPKKAGFRRLFPPDHPARLTLEAQPDMVSEEADAGDRGKGPPAQGARAPLEGGRPACGPALGDVPEGGTPR
jgi:hypothetical protein